MYPAVQMLYDTVRFEAPGVTDNAIFMALFNAFDRFCRRTDANRFVATVPLIAGTNSYILEFTHTVVVRTFTVVHETMNLSSAEYDADEARLTLIEAPTVEDALYPAYVHVSLSCKAGSTDPDDWMGEFMWDRYRDVLTNGTIAELTSQIAKPYSSERKAMFHGRRYRNGMAASKALADVGNAPDGQGWRFPVIKG